MPHRAIAGVRAGLLPICAVLLLASVAGAQTVSGTVRDNRDGSPLPGAVVILVSATGEKIRGTLSAEDGGYRLPVPSSGTYSLRVDVVGYRSVSIVAFPVGDGEFVVRDVRFPFERVALPATVVRASTSCERVAGETGDAARLWSEARKALEATRLAQEERRFPVTVTRFERVLSLPDSAVQSSRSSQKTGVTDNPFVSLSPGSIASFGYLATQGDRDVYYAPDARVLLSDEFVAGHCFSTRRGGRRGAVGLAFRPASRPSHVEVDGVLWLDSATAELRALEYRYVPTLGRSERGGGNIEFGRFPSGIWGVTRWSIRMPILRVVESNRRPDGMPGRFVDTLVTAVQEEGGEVLAGGVARVSAPSRATRIRGTIFDSTLSKPLAGAVVTLEGAGRTVRSDSTGAFVIDSLTEIGTFRLRFWHARLDSLGVAMPRAAIRVRPGEETIADLVLPGANAVARERCGHVYETPVRLVTGLVRTATPAMGADVEVTVLEKLPETAGTESRIRRSSTSTDNGRFAICTLTPGSTAWILARADSRWTRPILLPQDARATAIELKTEANTADSSAGGGGGGYLQPAQIVELSRSASGSDDAMIEGWLLYDAAASQNATQVIVDGAVASMAAPSGTFRVPRVSEGMHLVSFRNGASTSGSLAVSSRRAESTILLAVVSSRPAAVAAAAAPSRAARRAAIATRSGFEERRRQGQGVFFDRARIERTRALALVDLLRGVPGVRVVPSTTGYRYQATNEHFTVGPVTAAKPDRADPGRVSAPPLGAKSGCDLQFFIDGVPFPIDQGNVDMQIHPSEIAAMEIYPTASSVPRQFGGADAACGVVVIWRT